jgi:cellulose synthase/poly-beta-1,6-N-acetylglucosamine synthase-like glycosyltransferase
MAMRRGQHGKAGNQNYGLSQSSGDYILLLDADMAPEAYCLQVLMLGLVQGGPSMAFMQGPHRFYDVPKGDVFFSRSLIFNVKTLEFFGSYGMCPFVGSNTLFRRTALESVHGIDEHSITEDIVTSFKMHELGWRSGFVPVPVCFGTSPQSGPQMLTQRIRWAWGGLEFALQYGHRLWSLSYVTKYLFLFIITNSIIGPLVYTGLFAALCIALAFQYQIYLPSIGAYTLVYIIGFKAAWLSGLACKRWENTFELWSEEVTGPHYLIPVTVVMWGIFVEYGFRLIRKPTGTKAWKSTAAARSLALKHAIIIKLISMASVILLFCGLFGIFTYYYRYRYSALLISYYVISYGLRTAASSYWYCIEHKVPEYSTVDASLACLNNWRFAGMCVLPTLEILGVLSICIFLWIFQSSTVTRFIGFVP